MNITIAIYSFYLNNVIIKKPFKIERETDKCYFTKDARFLKADIGKPIMKYPNSYPYIEVVMIDADEETLREELRKWFTDKACEICR